MKNRLAALLFSGLLASALLSAAAIAQDDPEHPRVNEVDQRLENQQNRIDNGMNQGQLTPGQAQRDENRDARINREAGRDEARHGGHLTKREDRRLNRQLNRSSRHIHHQRHGTRFGRHRHLHPTGGK